MKHLKIYEKYEDNEIDEISERYANFVVSHYIDNHLNGGTLQESFDYYCDELEDDDQRGYVDEEIEKLIDKLTEEFKIKKDSKKYNI